MSFKTVLAALLFAVFTTFILINDKLARPVRSRPLPDKRFRLWPQALFVRDEDLESPGKSLHPNDRSRSRCK